MTVWQRIRNWFRRHELSVVVWALVLLLVVTFAWPYVVTIVPAGSAGVVWSRISGTKLQVIAGEGIHFTPPWQSIAVYNLRYQVIDLEVTILTKDGLEVVVQATTRFRPIYRQLTTLHQEVGPDYRQTIVLPEVSTAVRIVAGQFEPEQFYSQGITTMQDQVIEVARDRIRTRYVEVDDVYIRSIIMPRTVALAIQHKIEQEQQALTMAHRLEFERQEVLRKEIEANGIRAFQAIISAGLTNQYLRYKGIEATLELAQSPNSKIIVIDGGPNGLPLVLNAEGMPSGGAQPIPLPGQSVNATPATPFFFPPPTSRPPAAATTKPPLPK